MDAWVPIASASVGALAALSSQFISWRSGERRFQAERAQRELEMRLRHSEPLRDRRIAAHERFHEALQEILETGTFSEREYVAIRPHFAYVGDDLRAELIRVLSRAQAAPDSPDREAHLSEIRQVQAAIRRYLTPSAELREGANG